MNPLVAISLGLRESAAHKFRTCLSMLGIVLGVSSLIATMALTRGIEEGTRIFMQQMGGLELVSIVNKEPSSRKYEFANLSPGRTLREPSWAAEWFHGCHQTGSRGPAVGLRLITCVWWCPQPVYGCTQQMSMGRGTKECEARMTSARQSQ